MSTRYRAYLEDRYRLLLWYMGGIWAITGVTILSPLLVIPFFQADIVHAWVFLITGLPLIALGVGLRHYITVEDERSPSLQEGMVAILLSWVVAIVVGTLPFMLISNLNFSQAIFESTSGWTTTGLSVVDVTLAPPILLFYRSVIQLVGGAGFAIIVLSSITGPVGSGLSEAEGRDDKLAPNVRHSASLVVQIYATYIILGIVAYIVAGMPVFDAVNHAFAALSTGGFSTRPDSIGHYDSIAIEAVTLVLMVLGTLNFLTAWLVVRGKWRDVSRNGEVRLLVLIIPLASVFIFASTVGAVYASAGETMRIAVFQVVSAASTTGFSTVGYTDWTQPAVMVMIILMMIGGGSGSTSGGIKQFRIYILLNALIWEVRRAFLPDSAVNRAYIWRGSKRVPLSDRQVRRTALYVFFYMVLFFTLTLIVLFHGDYSIAAALFETASTISTVGLSVGVTSADAPVTLLWVQSFGMLLGRLEFYALFIGFIKLGSDMSTLLFPRKRQKQAT